MAVVGALVIAGFALRLQGLSTEGLSEDELNKLSAVNEYRSQGLTSANGEHPLLMKALLTISVIGTEAWDRTSLATSHPTLDVPVEASLRIPSAVFGAFTAPLIFLVASELFGLEVGLLAAALWTFEPLAISFNRIAKEDTFLVFFFMLANVFWLRGQQIAETRPDRNPERYYWATAIAFGAMLASKLLPIMMAVPVAYNYVFQKIPVTRWVIGKKRFIKFFLLVGLTFVILSPTILLPDTWTAMRNFTSSRTVAHDGYEFMGRLYSHRFTDWLNGQPWYFYFVLLGTKLSIPSVLGFIGGFVLLFRRKTGDGRYLLLLWYMFWTVTFMFAGGKFTRYIMPILPAVIVTAAIGIHFAARAFGSLCSRFFKYDTARSYGRAALLSVVVVVTFWAAASAAPHYRLYVNALAGGEAKAGAYFPQDEFYDAYMQEIVNEIARRARPGARIASEVDSVAVFYARKANRTDLISLQLSDPTTLAKLAVGDFVIDARGRTYFSNQAMLTRLRQTSRPAFSVGVGNIPAADVYVLDQRSLNALRGVS